MTSCNTIVIRSGGPFDAFEPGLRARGGRATAQPVEPYAGTPECRLSAMAGCCGRELSALASDSGDVATEPPPRLRRAALAASRFRFPFAYR